jgi:predicted transcriptional regulator
MSETAWSGESEEIPDSDAEVRVERRKQMARALARSGMTDVQVLSHESAERVLTPKRRELVAVLTDETVESVRGLARRVERDKGQVSRDLKVLAEHGVVDFEKTGREKQPYLQHDHLVVEPIY